jgi:hypothetical protein
MVSEVMELEILQPGGSRGPPEGLPYLLPAVRRPPGPRTVIQSARSTPSWAGRSEDRGHPHRSVLGTDIGIVPGQRASSRTAQTQLLRGFKASFDVRVGWILVVIHLRRLHPSDNALREPNFRNIPQRRLDLLEPPRFRRRQCGRLLQSVYERHRRMPSIRGRRRRRLLGRRRRNERHALRQCRRRIDALRRCGVGSCIRIDRRRGNTAGDRSFDRRVDARPRDRCCRGVVA